MINKRGLLSEASRASASHGIFSARTVGGTVKDDRKQLFDVTNWLGT